MLNSSWELEASFLFSLIWFATISERCLELKSAVSLSVSHWSSKICMMCWYSKVSLRGVNIVSTFVSREVSCFSILVRWSWPVVMANFWLASISSSALFLATREVFHSGSAMVVFISVRHLLKAVFFWTCIFLYSRRVSPWSSSSRLSLSWSLRCRASRFLRSSHSSREVEYSSLGTTF